MERFSKVFRPLPTDGFRAIASYVLEKVRGEDLVFTGTTNPHNWKAAHGDCKFALSRSKEGAFFKPTDLSELRARCRPPNRMHQWNKLVVKDWGTENYPRPLIVAIDPAMGNGTGDDISITAIDQETGALILQAASNKVPYDLIPNLVKWLASNWIINKVAIERQHESGRAMIRMLVRDLSDILMRHKGEIGWSTDGESRPRMMNLVIDGVRNKAFDIPDETVIDQLADLVLKDDKLEAKSGCHDDMIISWAIAQMARKKILNSSYRVRPGKSNDRLYKHPSVDNPLRAPPGKPVSEDKKATDPKYGHARWGQY